MKRSRISENILNVFIAFGLVFGARGVSISLAERKGYADGYEGQKNALKGERFCPDLSKKGATLWSLFGQGFCLVKRDVFDAPYEKAFMMGLYARIGREIVGEFRERKKAADGGKQELKDVAPAAPSPFSSGDVIIREIDPESIPNSGSLLHLINERLRSDERKKKQGGCFHGHDNSCCI